MFVLCFDVIGRFLWSVGLAVTNESRIRFRDIIEKKLDRLVQRLRRDDLPAEHRQKNQGGQKACASTHENNSASAVLPRASYPTKKEFRDKQVGPLDCAGYGPECRRRFAVALQDENHRSCGEAKVYFPYPIGRVGPAIAAVQQFWSAPHRFSFDRSFADVRAMLAR